MYKKYYNVISHLLYLFKKEFKNNRQKDKISKNRRIERRDIVVKSKNSLPTTSKKKQRYLKIIGTKFSLITR